MKRILSSGGLVAVGLMANIGCVGRGRVVEHQRPSERVVVEQPAPPPQEVVIFQQSPPPTEMVVIVRETPPPEVLERRPPQSSRRAVWVSGYWVRHRDRWVWVSGQWRLPPRQDAAWVAPRWERRGPEFHFTLGFWR